MPIFIKYTGSSPSLAGASLEIPEDQVDSPFVLASAADYIRSKLCGINWQSAKYAFDIYEPDSHHKYLMNWKEDF